jgi:hypothetical protein
VWTNLIKDRPAAKATIDLKFWAVFSHRRGLIDSWLRHRGYTGSFSHLARFLAPWRSGEPSLQGADQEEPAPVGVRLSCSALG